MGNKFSHTILTRFYKVYNLYIAYFCRFEKKMCAFECIYIHVYAIYMYIVCQNFWTFVWARSLYLFLEIMQVKVNDNVKKKINSSGIPVSWPLSSLTIPFPDRSSTSTHVICGILSSFTYRMPLPVFVSWYIEHLRTSK